ncbi:GtrA family protein [Helicobacter himalayensis]|uniref:GtrA family protein n=1 Tax=Helicobacter himalayensis TaxID=1591088 RepID=UPI003D6EC130
MSQKLPKQKLQVLLSHSALRYGLVGVANTIVGLGVTFFLTFIGVLPELASTFGIIVGVINSYFLNKHFTFKSQNSHKSDFVRFCVAMGISYAVNMLILTLSFRVFEIDKYISIIIANVAYTITGYFISRFWAFKQRQ